MAHILRATEMVRKVNADTPAANGQARIQQGNTLRFHIPYVGGNAILNPKSLIIRGRFYVGVVPVTAPSTQPQVFFQREGIQGIFKNMRILHGDRLIEEISRYSDYASWYTQLHNSGANGTSLHCPGSFCDLGNYVSAALATTLWPDSGESPIGPLDGGATGHEFAFAPLSAILGSRATKDKFPLCVLNPMEPLVIEFDLDTDGSLINWGTLPGGGPTSAIVGSFTLGECYLNADYDMVGDSLGRQLKESSAGISWDIPGLEKHEHILPMPAGVLPTDAATSYGGDVPPDIVDRFLIRSNVQAMTRLIHYFKHQGYEQSTTTSVDERAFLQYPELTSWQYQIENMLVPDRAMTAQIYQTGAPTAIGGMWPRAHMGRIWTTSMKTVGELLLAPTCGFQPMFELVFDYTKKLPGGPAVITPTIFSMTKPFEMEGTDGARGDDGGFFMAYDFTRQVEGGAGKTAPWGDGSFRLRGTDFEVILGMNNRLGNRTGQSPLDYNLVVVTLVEYKRRMVIDKLGRFDAYF